MAQPGGHPRCLLQLQLFGGGHHVRIGGPAAAPQQCLPEARRAGCDAEACVRGEAGDQSPSRWL
ncbi:hypothetical protein [Streptomyces sp. 147326]|uniref:hypothetical protein n=1 Tax=Streptomyces sp. 147326 TaxID=3074379 RepID=UPI0038578DCD